MDTPDHNLSNAISTSLITFKAKRDETQKHVTGSISTSIDMLRANAYAFDAKETPQQPETLATLYTRDHEAEDRNDTRKLPPLNSMATPSVITNNRGSYRVQEVSVPRLSLSQKLVISSYLFPLQEIRVESRRREYISFQDLSGLRHVVDGSNSNIVKAMYKKETPVIIKIIQKNPMDPRVAEKEFVLENEILMRLSHPNIVTYYGGGKESDHRRRFIVLEVLTGGSLMNILSRPNRPAGPLFTYGRVLEIAKMFADALDYLHDGWHPAATIIHRDLKPDNIGFTESGILKLMDFGLCACVRKRTEAHQVYTMTGSTGSLRYMAPEVMREIPYTERVDVYSFGLILWQIATGQTPYGHLTRADFFQKVVDQNERPPMGMSSKTVLTEGLIRIIAACWDANPDKRFSSSELVDLINQLIQEMHPTRHKGNFMTYLRNLIRK